MDNKIIFNSEIKEVKTKNLVSLDKGFDVLFRGEDPETAKLSFVPCKTIVKVTVEWE